MPYRGEITTTSGDRAPFLVTVSDEIGHVFGTFPASTRARAEGRIAEVVAALKGLDEKLSTDVP
jgi:hypothetical protein